MDEQETSTKDHGGRPSIRSQDLANIICERIADGESLRAICLAESMPSRSFVRVWLSQDAEFMRQYARAREEQADSLAEEILQIADDGSNDTYTDDRGNPRVNQDVVQRSRLRFEARRWYASKLAPKKYSDRLEMEHSGQIDSHVVLTEERRKELIAKRRAARAAQLE